jgi:non-specific serine/threonine protein kinase
MGPSEPTTSSPARAARPRWSEVLRALREARGVTLDGWGARLGVSRKTVQRWERGERTPDPGAEAAIVAYCREAGLFRAYDGGPLAGLDLTAERLRDLLAEARWRAGGPPTAARAPDQPPTPGPADATPAAPARMLPAPSSNLPAQLTSFVGRETELATVRRIQAGTRLLTLTGAGGCGKTRLALRVAHELLWAYPHGVWFVDLAPLTDPALAPQALAAALDVPAIGQRPLVETLSELLRPRHLLLVLDNCEHLLPACAELAETLLRACPHLEILATSREPLGVAGEVVYRVPPMAVPEAGFHVPGSTLHGAAHSTAADQMHRGTWNLERGTDSDAVRLFVERARLRCPDLSLTPGDAAAVAEICVRLDGMPLAIELAAARIDVLSPSQIAERLQDRFRLLTGRGRAGVPRHQTLRATMDWSHELLAEPERALLRALSVFAGGFTLEAAEAACGEGNGQRATSSEQRATRGGPVPSSLLAARCPLPSSLPVAPDDVLDLLTALVDKSLVIAEEQEGAVRYRLLETVRQYAGEKLEEAGEDAAARDRHAAWYLALAEAAAPELYGPRVLEWLARLEREHDNLRAALARSLAEDRPSPDASLRLTVALTRYWDLRGHVAEGRRWLTRALAAGEAAPAAARAGALHGAGILAHFHGDFAAAAAHFDASLRLCRGLGDDDGVARAEAHLGTIAFRRGEYAVARAFLEAGLARAVARGNRPVISAAQAILGQIALRQGDYKTADALIEASLAIQRELGDKHGIAGRLDDVATLAGELGDEARQDAALAESLSLFRELGHKGGIALVLGSYGMRFWLRREHERAAALLDESLTLYREVGERASIARVLGYQSVVALFARDYPRAEALSRECLALYREVGDVWAVGRYLPVLAGVMFAAGRTERSATLLGAAAPVRERLGASLPPAFRTAHDRTVDALRATLGAPAFAAAWQAGAALSLEEALEYALAGGIPT